MTSGAGTGTSGAGRLPAWALAYAIIVPITLIVGTVNVLSVLDERSWMGRPIEWWEPAVWEMSSGIALIALAWLPGFAALRYPPTGPGALRHLALHLLLTLPFSIAHVALMAAIRHAAYAAAGETYVFGPALETFLYEYRKDVTSYLLYAVTFWLAGRLSPGPMPAAAEPPPPAQADENFLIDEGQRVLRVPPASILGARSSGNYVEFLLADGRRPLMRSTLAAVEAALAAKAFVRTHRSWLVNARHVTEIEAQGSGDYGLTLADGTRVPLSRRYRDALEALRQG